MPITVRKSVISLTGVKRPLDQIELIEIRVQNIGLMTDTLCDKCVATDNDDDNF